ncbi:MAG: DnaJ domain-containing protein [Candidatus Thermoplasmatota archaeon]|nr:DnaJ domain-containing protein [Candidatus Thermoplasmatota archaeon]
MADDHYTILGIEDDATQDDVKKAYRKLAKNLHPDLNKDDSTGAADRFKKVKEAYEILSNPLKREKYDLELMRSGSASNQSPVPQSVGFVYTGPPLAPQRGSDVKLVMKILFQESFSGVKKGVDVKMPVRCTNCGGSGSAPGTPVSTCPTCRGSGALLQPVQTPQGYINQRIICTTCNGRGILMQQFCQRCSGVGLVNGSDNVILSLPPGVEDGAIIKINGKGGYGLGNGPRGDLLITVNVEELPNMKRVDNDLYIEESISLPKAVFGGKQRVNTLEGRRTLRIPSLTKSRTEFLIESEGFPDPVTGEHGDLYVVVYIDPPEDLTEGAKKALKKYALEMGEDLNDLGL